MTRYSDPFVCPDCRGRLPALPVACPTCGLPLQGPLAAALFGTLQHADQLLLELRPSPTSARLASPSQVLPVSRRTDETAATRSGVRPSSVAGILLGLGALCLLVAAVTFLAVAWSWLGIGGRTVVLVALTATAAGLGTWFGSRRLRIAGESLTVVAYGLLLLDVVGARNAGWLGDLSTAGTTTVLGATLLLGALALLWSPSRLVTPQVVAPLGLLLVTLGVAGLTVHDQQVAGGAVLAFALLAALDALGARLDLRPQPVLPWAALVGGGTVWALLVLLGAADAADHLSLEGLWLDGHGLGLLAASALLLPPVAFLPRDRTVVQLCGGAAASLATVVLVLPAADEGSSTVTAITLLVLLGWSAVLTATPVGWRWIPRAPLALAAVPVVVVATGLALQAVGTVLTVGAPYSRSVGVLLEPGPPLARPVLLLASVVVLLVAAAALGAHRVRLPDLVAVVGLTGVATSALHPVPLGVVVAGLAGVVAVLLADGVRRTGLPAAARVLAAFIVAVAGLLAALPSAWLTVAAATVLLLGAATVLAGERLPVVIAVAGAVLPLGTAALLWSVGEATGADPALRGVGVVLAMGLIALVRPRPEVETTAWLAALVATVPAVAAAADPSVSLAVHLTVAGALVVASALRNPTRRELAWPGGLLLAGATWVRLLDLGVHAPEAYTLPTAAVLLLLALHHLRRHPAAGTWRALAPALLLATVPSLLWVLAGDVISARAALLGLGCLVLVVTGSRLRWNAPLLIGAAVGALLVLRELAPYAATTPQWVLIGLAGTLLTVVGVTWERRVTDLRQASDYLERLR